MIFTNATFKKTKDPITNVVCAIKVTYSDRALAISVPMKETNSDYAEIKAAADAGEITIQEAD
jgi:hypothetical protein|tara:strand:+ start:426 stop:614 length:189 start_codon:yes stop_codon:yes gene_type:complete